MIEKEHEKVEKYRDLASEIKRMCSVRTSMIIEINCLKVKSKL